jgi:hypothetical protein
MFHVLNYKRNNCTKSCKQLSTTNVVFKWLERMVTTSAYIYTQARGNISAEDPQSYVRFIGGMLKCREPSAASDMQAVGQLSCRTSAVRSTKTIIDFAIAQSFCRHWNAESRHFIYILEVYIYIYIACGEATAKDCRSKCTKVSCKTCFSKTWRIEIFY